MPIIVQPNGDVRLTLSQAVFEEGGMSQGSL